MGYRCLSHVDYTMIRGSIAFPVLLSQLLSYTPSQPEYLPRYGGVEHRLFLEHHSLTLLQKSKSRSKSKSKFLLLVLFRQSGLSPVVL